MSSGREASSRESAGPADRSAAQGHTAWPGRLVEVAGELRRASRAENDALRDEFWLLLRHALGARMRAESRRLGSVSHDELRDLVSQRALELAIRFDEGKWDLEQAAPAQVMAFFSRVSRNALIDHLRKRQRQAEVSIEDVDHHRASPKGSLARPVAAPDVSAQRREFVDALVACLANLKPVHARIWFWRAVLELPTRIVSAHPEVGLKVAHVDVIQQRNRQHIAQCMRTRGFRTTDMPPGTLVELWRRLQDGTFTAGGEP